MSKLKKIFSKGLPEHLVRYFHNKSGKIVDSFNKRKSVIKDKKWSEKFSNHSSLLYELDNTIKINLYKASILSRLIFEGFEKDEIEFMTKVIKEGDILIDVGANIGLFSLIASKIVGKYGKVISFEPSPQSYLRLLENIDTNNFTNIEARNIGLSDKQGKLTLNLSESGFDAWNTFATGEMDKFQNSIEVNVSTLDEELRQINKDKISFIKIDVEGWEKFVLEGGKEILQNYSPTLLIEFTETNTFAAGYSVHELYDAMINLNYAWYRYINGRLIFEEKKLHYPYDNLIATKNIDQLNEKLI